MRQRVFQRLARGGDRVAGFFPGRVRAAQTDRNVQRPFQQPLDHPARQATDDGQIGDQRRELRPTLALDLVGHRRLRRLPACRTHDLGTLKLGDVRLDRRQLGHLMPPADAGHRAPPACRGHGDTRWEIVPRPHSRARVGPAAGSVPDGRPGRRVCADSSFAVPGRVDGPLNRPRTGAWTTWSSSAGGGRARVRALRSAWLARRPVRGVVHSPASVAQSFPPRGAEALDHALVCSSTALATTQASRLR